MTRPVHPAAALLDGILEAFRRELQRQDGALQDLPPLYGNGRKRGDLAGLKKNPRDSDTGARNEDAA